MQSDTDWLDSQDAFWNACLVKKIDFNTKELIPTHILFHYWFGAHSIQLKAYPTEVGHNYDVYYKDKLLCKNINVESIEQELSKFDVIVRKHSSMSSDLEIIKRSRNKCLQRKNTRRKQSKSKEREKV